MNLNAPRRRADLPPPPRALLPLGRNDLGHEHAAGHNGHGADSRGGHGWMMIACCIPMLLIAVLLVVTGAASVGFLGAAIACTVMMALMMRAMDSGGHDHPGPDR